jgi:thioredoxin reductase (NADPH)
MINMPEIEPSRSDAGGFLGTEVEKQLKAAFDALPFDIPVYLFTRKGEGDAMDRAARSLAGVFQKLSSRIRLKELDVGDREGNRLKISSSPTFVFGPERYSIKYLGVPFGEEGKTLVGALLLLGLGSSGLGEESLKIMKRLDSRREIKVFVSPTCPYCPEQAIHAMKAAMERPDLVSLEIIDIQSNPEIADRYSAFSVPQVYANDILIAQGAQPEELFILSLLKLEPQTVFIPESDAEVVETDVVIVGGGPAGLTAGIYAVRSGLKTVVVERGALGGQVATTPIVENYPGFTRVPGKTLVDILVSHALEYVQIFPGEEVVDIRFGDTMEVLTSRRRFVARAVILATGARYRHLDVPGEMRLAGRGVSYCATCDGPLFRGKRVIVVGGGNSATTEALYLHNIGVDVTIVHRRDTLRAQEHLVRSVQDSGIPVLWNTEVREIRGVEKVKEVSVYNNRTGETSSLPVDGVFIAVGYVPTVDLARKIGVELTPDGFIRHDSRHRTNIPGVYSAGDVEGGYKQIVTAMGQGTEAALSVFEDLRNPYWLDEGGWVGSLLMKNRGNDLSSRGA